VAKKTRQRLTEDEARENETDFDRARAVSCHAGGRFAISGRYSDARTREERGEEGTALSHGIAASIKFAIEEIAPAVLHRF